ncbi:LysR family transcriptional regulator [Caldalkalibacillus mannanilyticus]|uniref:LysR family transcriptional regulator n=1 Tax=Caldalkalibacillus mannanilyticus TaxID=1418 RepID=UPI00046A0883|nr:LysR family transcriptional regulator [Caldalkalibacillus mannanilyticus]
MDFHRLEILVHLAKHKKMTDVAEILKMKQPTISFHLKKLEEETGVVLFRRYHKNFILTEAGKALVHYAENLLNIREEALRVMNEYKENQRGSLAVGASHVPAAYLLPRIFGEFLELYPPIQLSLKVLTAPVVLQLIEEHTLDIGMVLEREIDSRTFTSIPLYQEELVLVFHPQHRFASLPNITLEEIEKEPLILHQESSTTRKMCHRWAINNGITLQSKMELGSAEAIKEAIDCTIGYSILAKTAVHREVQTGRLFSRELPGIIEPYFFYLVYHPDRLDTPVFQTFLAFVQDYFRSK